MRRCRLLAQLGRARMSAIWLLSGAKRTSARVGELVAASMPQHVRMNLEREASLATQPGDHPAKAADRERRTAFGHEHERGFGRLALDPAQGPQLDARQRMNRGRAVLAAIKPR